LTRRVSRSWDPVGANEVDGAREMVLALDIALSINRGVGCASMIVAEVAPLIDEQDFSVLRPESSWNGPYEAPSRSRDIDL
jgi:hypothetical protein